MPLQFHRYLQQQAELGLWHITEPESYFLDMMTLYPAEAEQLAKMMGHRRLEWLAGRWLLHQMSGRSLRGACLKDEHGKPYLENSLFDISLSHSHDVVAVMAAPVTIGVDIQYLVPKIERIAHKYMRDEEMDSLHPDTRLEHLHVYWGAKESLYKAYGRRSLDFKTHILIEPFLYDLKNGHFKGKVLKEHFNKDFELRYEQHGKFILVHAMEQTVDQRIA